MSSISNAADDLTIDKKTFRKLLKGQKTSFKTGQKVKSYAESELNITTKDYEKSWLEGDRNLLHHGQWKGLLIGIRNSAKNKKSFFLDQIERLLDADIKIFQKCMQNKDSLESHELFWRTELAKQLLEPWGLKDTPSLDRHTDLCSLGAMSINLYFIASYEIGMKQKHCVLIDGQSLVADLLPNLVDEKIEWPIKKITDYWSVKFDVSVNALGESLPFISGLDSDSKARKLDAWRSGKNQPQMYSEDSVLKWLKSFCPDAKTLNRELVRFQTMLLVQRFFNFLLKNEFEQEWLVKAFEIYNSHYKNNFNRFNG